MITNRDVCPTCNQYINNNKPKRICCKCGMQIKGSHKFRFNEEGRVEHRICEEPEAYIKTEPVVFNCDKCGKKRYNCICEKKSPCSYDGNKG